MPQGGTQRRLATVMFIDIVGSTRVASDIGDHRWRELLSRFRRIVRAELKRYAGREENFTGDGFLATFQEPIQAIRAGAAIAGAVQELGIEVRCGIHTGECERIEGSLGGIAVHIASRVMSLAGPAEVLATSTVKELVTGSGISFEDFSAHELKGVPGTWQIYAVTEADGSPLAPPLDAADAAARIGIVEPSPFFKKRAKLLAGAGAVVIAAVIGSVVLLAGGGSPKASQQLETITLVRLDPKSGKIVQTLRDQYYSHHMHAALWAADGSLWQYVNGLAVRRDIRTGKPELTIRVSPDIHAGAPGFGAAWTAAPSGRNGNEVDRYDEATGRRLAKISIPGPPIASMSAGNGAMWALLVDGTLVRIDPLSNKVAGTFDTHTSAPGVVVALDGYTWICDCEVGHVIQFDPRRNVVVRRLSLPEHGFLVDVDTQGGHTVWMLDPSGNTLTPIQPNTGRKGQPIGFGGQLADAKIGFGALWVAASNAVYKINLSTHHQKLIPIPASMTAGSIAIDEQTNSVWVGNCGCPRNG